MRRIALTAALAIVGLSACEKSISEPEGPMTGTWRFQAADLLDGPLLPIPRHCKVDVYLEIVQSGNTIEGESRDAKWTCFNPETGNTEERGVDTQVYGEVQDGRVHLIFGNAWHSYGELHPQRIEGYVEQYTGSSHPGPIGPVRVGDFVLTRE